MRTIGLNQTRSAFPCIERVTHPWLNELQREWFM